MNAPTVCEKRHGDLVELQALQSDGDAMPLMELQPENDDGYSFYRSAWCVS